MYASRHAVFAGPGELPKELREVLRRRDGQPVTELELRAPTLLAAFGSAADAEKIAGQLDRLGLGALVVGPEQPPPTAAWFVATGLAREGGHWVASGPAGTRVVQPAQVRSLTVVQWRPDVGAPDRALLLKDLGEQPLYVAAGRLAQAAGSHAQALRLLAELAEDVGTGAAASLRVRERRVTPERFELLAVEGDRLALATAAVDALDPQPASAPRRLDAPRPRALAAAPTPAALALPRTLRAASLAALGAALVVGATSALLDGRPVFVAWGLAAALAAWGSSRLAWAQHLARRAGGSVGWPLAEAVAGRRPRWLEVGWDAVVLAAAWGAHHAAVFPLSGLADVVAIASAAGLLLTLRARRAAEDEEPGA